MSKVYAYAKANSFKKRMFALFMAFEAFQQSQTAAWRTSTPAWQKTPRGNQCDDFVLSLEDAAALFQEAIRILEDGTNAFKDGQGAAHA